MSGPAILVVGPSWVGDMVMAQSLFKVLAREHAGAAIDVLAPGWSLPVIQRMDEVRSGIEMPVGHGELGLAARRRLGRELRGAGYHRAIVLPRSFKAALVPFFAKVPVRTGFRGEMRFGLVNDMRKLDKAVLSTTVSRYVALGLPADAAQPPETPYPSLRVDPDNQQRLKSTLGLDADRDVVALLPGAEYGPAKQWPVASYGKLAQQLIASGRGVWVLGSAKEREAGEAIAAIGGDRVRNLCGSTQLADAIDLIAAADAAVTNDSGLMHVAAATGRHLVALYGSSSPEYTPPLSDRASILRIDIECSPCFARTCRFDHYRCLRDIGVERVAACL